MGTVRLESMVAGTVWQLLRQPGDRVNSGEAVLVVESMKMEIPLDAPAAATVLEVLVAEGDLVKEGQVLVVLELT